jgi:proteasome lid subunit RPN8/RPN11
MTPETLEAFRGHAVAEYPRECCGLFIVVKGRERYVPCRNQAANPTEQFRLHPEDYAAAEDLGDVIAVGHSHPDVPARPSEGDLVACEASGLPWYIAAVTATGAGEVHRFQPSGYGAPLVGRQFFHGVLDCYTLCRDWYAREAGIVLPDFERTDGWWDDGRSDLYTAHFREAGFEPLPAGQPIRRGDAILMQVRSKNGVPNHAGVYLDEGRSLFLHHLYGRLSSRDVYGGMWAEYTRLIIRHKDFTP